GLEIRRSYFVTDVPQLLYRVPIGRLRSIWTPPPSTIGDPVSAQRLMTPATVAVFKLGATTGANLPILGRIVKSVISTNGASIIAFHSVMDTPPDNNQGLYETDASATTVYQAALDAQGLV